MTQGNASVWRAGAAAAGLCALFAPAVAAQTADAACRADGEACFTLLGVTLDGAHALSQADLAGAYEPFLTRPVSLTDLARIADAITTRYRARGYFLSRAVVPPGDFSAGVARIVIIEGRIDDVIVEGEARAQVEPYLRGLVQSGPAQLSDLDAALALAQDLPGVSVRTEIAPHPEDLAAHRLIVRAELARFAGYISFDNRGTEEFGPLQAQGVAELHSVLQLRDRLALSFATTPASTDEFSFAELSYGVTLESGARISAAVSGARTAGDSAAAPPRLGEGMTLAFRYEAPLYRMRAAGFWWGLGFDARHAVSDESGGGSADELRVARLSLRGVQRTDDGETMWRLRLSHGMDVLGASNHSGLRRTRPDADGGFVSADLYATYYHAFGRRFGVFAEVAGQWADGPVLASEEFAVGGAAFGRAFDEGELSGDRGLAASVELRAGDDPAGTLLSFAQTYLFADAARIWDYGAEGESLHSAGGGMRLTFDDWLTLRWELARPLGRTPVEQLDRDWRNFLSLSAAY